MIYHAALLTTLTLGSFALSGIAAAQTAKDLVGTWTLVGAETVLPDGKNNPTFGAKPSGMLIFTGDGHFLYLYTRGDMPKIASNSRASVTPQEAAEVVKGSIAT